MLIEHFLHKFDIIDSQCQIHEPFTEHSQGYTFSIVVECVTEDDETFSVLVPFLAQSTTENGFEADIFDGEPVIVNYQGNQFAVPDDYIEENRQEFFSYLVNGGFLEILEQQIELTQEHFK